MRYDIFFQPVVKIRKDNLYKVDNKNKSLAHGKDWIETSYVSFPNIISEEISVRWRGKDRV